MAMPVPLAAFITYLPPLIAWLIWKKKTGASVFPLIIGFAAYTCVILPRFILRAMVSYNELRQTNVFLWYLARGIISGGCEEGIRLAVFIFLLKSPKMDGWVNAVSYGFGHGACEMLLATGLSGCTFWDSFYNGCGFITNMAFSAAMSVLVYAAAVHAEDKRLFFAAYALHFFADVIPLVYEIQQTGTAFLMYIIIDILFTAGCCMFAYKVFRSFPDSPQHDLPYSD